ncbi:MAG: AMP-binding protein [Burkholderiaceae bacterium]|nr:AMP-binding protein [Burkholderiaceae bacterium]
MRVRQGHDNYRSLYEGFGWQVPEYFNIAQVCCTRWAEGTQTRRLPAIHAARPDGTHKTHSYLQLQQEANRLSNLLETLGVRRGDRVAIVMPQRFETAVAYMAVFQMGAVAVPLSMLFGPEALEFRLRDSQAVVAIADESTLGHLSEARVGCPGLRRVLAFGDVAGQSDIEFELQLALQPARYAAVPTRSEDPALIIYTSGTTGAPRGALWPHRVLIGNLTGFVCSQDWFGFDGAENAASAAVFWSPADWAWTGGLMDALLPTLYFGRPIVAYNGRFHPETAFELMQAHQVTHCFLFPTALKAMMKAFPKPRKRFRLRLQALMSGGEAVGEAVFAYCRDELGLIVNEIFGQTEINYIVGNCGLHWPARPGSMGRPYPGHRVAVLDAHDRPCGPGEVGDVSVHRRDIHGHPDPVFFLGYWRNDKGTQAKFSGDWCRTGDLAAWDEDGYLWYKGRADDVFKSSGYRIGPSEIEDCLVGHAAVANAAVVPKPDRERGAVVKAYVVLSADYLREQGQTGLGSPQFQAGLTVQLQNHVKGRLAPYEYPKEIEFIDILPMTTTGKVQRRILRQREEAREAGQAPGPRYLAQ